MKVAFIDGEVYVDMSNEELFTHVAVKGEISRVWATLKLEHDLGECFPDGGLVTQKEANVSNNPDAIFVLWETVESGRVQFIPRKAAKGQFTEIQRCRPMRCWKSSATVPCERYSATARGVSSGRCPRILACGRSR